MMIKNARHAAAAFALALVAIPGAHHNDLRWVAGARSGQALRDFEASLRGR